MDVIAIDRLTKDYGETRALDASSWRLTRGQLLGFLGPNGAGKTTTIRILLGFLRPTSGRATILGMDAWRESTRVRRRVGYLAGDVRLYRHLTGRQTVDFVGGVRGMKNLDEARRLADLFQLDLGTRVGNYSKGMRQKLGLIVAMMHQPEFLILDEPTASLDPVMQQALHQELRQVIARGGTVLFSSHSLAEVQSLCEHVVILRAGRVVASTRLDTLRREAGQRVHLRLAKDLATVPACPEGFKVDQCRDGSLDGRWRGEPKVLLAWLAGLPLADVIIEPPDLEDVFLAFYDDRGRLLP